MQPYCTATKYNILSLPLVSPSERLTLNLLPDPVIPEPKSLIATSKSSPTLVRRARLILDGSHFSYLVPFPLSFPYEFPAPEHGEFMGEKHQRELEQELENKNLTVEERSAKLEEKHKKRMEQMETMMRRYEVQPDHVVQAKAEQGRLQRFLPAARTEQFFPSARLLALSSAALKDCLPHLYVGDAFEWIKRHQGREGPDTYSSGPMASTATSPQEKARNELSDFLSGRLIGASFSSGIDSSKSLEDDPKIGIGYEYLDIKAKTLSGELKEQEQTERAAQRSDELDERRKRGEAVGYAPWSLCYAGHQFGSWAGQLGDGRAVTLLETRNPETNQRWELQLKGAGRTPYSRFADGLATLGSSVREFLGSEAVAALGIPTSRALCIISLPDLKVVREHLNAAAITSRLNPSWLRIGSFQIHSSRAEWDSVRILGEYVAKDLLGFTYVVKGNSSDSRPPWARRLIEEVARRNAKTIALWQVYGFMHGVMNTDNIALLGQTIDYGPYAFMDIFDEGQICNHSDGEGRYAYRLQPTMGVFAIRELLNALAPVVGYENKHGKAPSPGELIGEMENLIDMSKKEAAQEIEVIFTSTLLDEWKTGWRKRLGLTSPDSDDKTLLDTLTIVLADLDFSTTLRNLCAFPAYLKKEGDAKQAAKLFSEEWCDLTVMPEYARGPKRQQAAAWLETYAKRLLSGSRDGDEVAKEMKEANPRFVLRNWVTTEVVKRLEEKDDTDFLDKVAKMCMSPFEDWGVATDGKSQEEVEEEAVSPLPTYWELITDIALRDSAQSAAH